jgi:hypothetical protein
MVKFQDPGWYYITLAPGEDVNYHVKSRNEKMIVTQVTLPYVGNGTNDKSPGEVHYFNNIDPIDPNSHSAIDSYYAMTMDESAILKVFENNSSICDDWDDANWITTSEKILIGDNYTIPRQQNGRLVRADSPWSAFVYVQDDTKSESPKKFACLQSITGGINNEEVENSLNDMFNDISENNIDLNPYIFTDAIFVPGCVGKITQEDLDHYLGLKSQSLTLHDSEIDASIGSIVLTVKEYSNNSLSYNVSLSKQPVHSRHTKIRIAISNTVQHISIPDYNWRSGISRSVEADLPMTLYAECADSNAYKPDKVTIVNPP